MCKRLTFLLVGLGALALLAATASAASYDLKISSGGNDMEERVPDSSIDSGSSDLEMPFESAGTTIGTAPQVVGLRFAVPLAKGAQITKAYVEFTCDETKGGKQEVNLVIDGQLVPDAPAFTTKAKDISSRARTKTQVKWAVENWTTTGQKSQTPDLSALITEIISQDGWASGNSLVLIFADDAGKPSAGVRCADAYEDSTTTCAVLHLEVFSPEAKNPDPANGAPEVTMPMFQWTAGDGALGHQVYFGTKAQLTEADKAGGPTAMPMYFHAPGLTPGVTYYWRVDEIDATGKVTTGPVWSFTAMPVKAYAPSPADWGVWQRTDTQISWKAGLGAASHKVYGGLKKAAVAAGDPNTLLGTPAETSYTLGKLPPLSVYYWKVDEVDAAGKVVPGDVWTINVAAANTGAWKTAAVAAGPGYLATYVADGVYDIGKFGGEQTYEFIVRSNPDETMASMCLLGRKDGTDPNKMGLKYEQWNNTKHYGVTTFGVKDYDSGVATAPGEYTHLAFVASKAGAKTDLYVNGVLKGSFAVAITLSGKVGIGYGIGGANQDTPFDNFDGSVFGVAVYDKLLTADQIAANANAFLLGGPEAVAFDLTIGKGDNDAEEHLNAGMDVTSTDLEMPYEDSGTPSSTDEQLTCLRYILPLDKGVQISKASVEFTCDETKDGSKPVNLIIEGQLAPNPAAFTSTAKDLTGRAPWTKAQVKWAVENWTTVGQKSKTPDLAAILQELVNQDGWGNGNAVVLAFRDDKSSPSTGLRCADAFEDGADVAPVLHIEVLVPWGQ